MGGPLLPASFFRLSVPLADVRYGSEADLSLAFVGVRSVPQADLNSKISLSRPGNPADTQSRYIEAAVRGVVIATLYAPNVRKGLLRLPSRGSTRRFRPYARPCRGAAARPCALRRRSRPSWHSRAGRRRQ